MNKKTQEIITWGSTIFAALCGLVAFAMIFITAINAAVPPYSILQSDYTGLQVALGCSTSGGYQIFNASAGLILAFIFPMIGACTAVIGKGFKVVTGVAAALMITGGALALAATSLVKPAVTFPEISLAAGPIVAGALSIVGGLILVGSVVFDMIVKKKTSENA